MKDCTDKFLPKNPWIRVDEPDKVNYNYNGLKFKAKLNEKNKFEQPEKITEKRFSL